MSTNNASAKKMSLEEFLGDDSLGESVWNEDDINLDAINNTTSIEVLKNTRSGDSNKNQNNSLNPQGNPHPNSMLHNSNRSSSLYHQDDYNNNNRSIIHSRSNTDHYGSNHQPQFDHQSNQSPVIQGPPYIVKFTNLPPSFANFDIEELFEAKYAKFVKFKIFWEINKNPSLSTLKSGSIFDQNFKREAKVAFVELFSGRDVMKILKYWTQPLKDIYKINTEPAQFDDFKEYISKIDLLTDPKDDPSKPYIAPKPKPNPFGSAKPVDTQSKILDIEEKMEILHVEDTEILRRLSEGEPLENLKPKVKILKKPQLSYSEVAQHSLVENTNTKKTPTPGVYSNGISVSPSSTLTNSNTARYNTDSSNDSRAVPSNENIATVVKEETKGDTAIQNDEQSNASETNEQENIPDNNESTCDNDNKEGQKSFTFKNQEREATPNTQNYNKNYRGGRGDYRGRGGRGGYSRGDSNHRGRGGNYSRDDSNHRGRGGYNQRYNNDNNNNKNNSYNRQESEKKDNTPSLFAPASGFLQDDSKNERGGHNNNTRGRGGYRRGHGNFRGGYN
ncbi:protein Psp2p [Monosporozyma servazzii]